MSISSLDNLVRRAFAYADGQVSFAFQGGEPSLAGAEFYRQLLLMQKKYNSRGVSVHNAIQTNGCSLSDELLEVLKEGQFLVGVSFDGSAAVHDRMRVDAAGNGSSTCVLNSIDCLEKSGIDFNILCVVNRYVAENAADTFRELRRYGYMQFIPCLDPFGGAAQDYSLTPEAYGDFLKETFRLYCKAFNEGRPASVRSFDNYIGILMGRPPENCGMCGSCGVYYLVEGDGSVYPCDFYVLDQWRMGNINDSSFFTLSHSETAERFRSVSRHVSPECRECRWYSLCRGGCRRDREPFVNGLPALNRWCEAYKAFFEQSYGDMLRMARTISKKERAGENR